MTPCRCGATFDPTSADDRRRHQMIYGHAPSERPRGPR